MILSADITCFSENKCRLVKKSVGGGGGKLTYNSKKLLKTLIAILDMTILSHYICPISIFLLGNSNGQKLSLETS